MFGHNYKILTNIIIFACVILFVIAQPTLSKSLYVIDDIAGVPTPMSSYDVQSGPSYLVYQATHNVPSYAGGAVGLSIDTDSEMLFVTYENSNIIQLVDATTMTGQGSVTAPGAYNLAGIVVDQEKQKVYTIDRGTNNLYVYSWNAGTMILTLDVLVHLTGVTAAHGLALDEIHDLLYVGGNVLTNNINVFSTDDWSLTASYTAAEMVIGIAVDVKNGFIYTGSAGWYGKNLSKYDMNTDVASSVTLFSLTGSYDDGALGLAVDPVTDLLYVTTGNMGSQGRTYDDTDCIMVLDSDLNLLYRTGDIGNPTGICIPGTDVSFNPLNLAKNEDVQGVGVPIGQNFTYDLTTENTNAFDVTGVTLTDNMPVELDFVTEYVDGVEGTGVYNPATHTVTWDLGTIGAGAEGPLVELVVLINGQAVEGTTIYNYATIESNETPPTTVIGEDPDDTTGAPGTNPILPTENCYDDLPAPQLVFEGCEDYEANGYLWTRYMLDVTNWAEYPDELFEPAPDLAPCGDNTNAARSWVDIFAADNSRLYGFCALGESENLQDIWFAMPRGEAPPAEVYIEIYDRRCDLTYTSNLTEITGSNINGYVTDNGAGALGVSIELYDGDGILLHTAITNEDGYYEFAGLGNGEHTVTLIPPLGFTCAEAIQEVMATCGTYEVNFELIEGAVGKLRHIWWWKVYLDDLRNDGPRVDEFTVDDVNNWLLAVYEHFNCRTDGYAIQIENATYKGMPAMPLTFDDLVMTLLDTHEGTYEAEVRKNLLVNLLNVASNKMSQNKIVSYDGATASQAITYYYQVYEENKAESNFDERNKLIKAFLDLRKMHMGQMIGAGIIPLTTPHVYYKGEADEYMPTEFTLRQNYPNPFNPTTTISFNLPTASDVTLEVFNLMGQKVATITEGTIEAGFHSFIWDASSKSSGMYLYKFTADDYVETKKMVLIK